jgi:spermidine synthase
MVKPADLLLAPLSGRLQVCLFTGAILISAFLLFWVQPLFAKMILPILGGSSSVWTTSMLFFQSALLAGYLYAHFTSRFLAVRAQILLHLALLGMAFLPLPFSIDYTRAESPEGSPALWVLSFAAMTVGLPFLMVSATAPMLQRWFSLTRHKNRDNPYFLYAASNLGSMAALFCFPVIFEPAFGTHRQTLHWQTVYAVLVVLLLASGFVTRRNLAANEQSTRKNPADAARPSIGRRLSWVFLAFVPSSMMLGLTSYVTTDISPISMFWIVPLALYLLSFVIVFSRYRQLIGDRSLAAVLVLCTAAFVLFKLTGLVSTTHTALLSIVLHTIFFFAAAWLLHGTLSSSKPPADRLTEFYLWLSVGGMLGGMFNAVVAPLIFHLIYEYYAVILPVFFFAVKLLVTKRGSAVRASADLAALFGTFLVLLLAADAIMSRPVTAAIRLTFLACSVILVAVVGSVHLRFSTRMPLRIVAYVAALAVLGNTLLRTSHANLVVARSFYGSMRVKLKYDKTGVPYHLLIHGSTRHNLQQFSSVPGLRLEPLLYYHREANLSHAIRAMQVHLHRPLQIGVVGLGAGATSAYLQEGDTATFYEIDSEVVAIAKNPEYFTYLSDTPGKTEVIVGDARLQLQKTPDSSFDMLLIDAFSSDAIPVHLLTAEALDMYLHKVKDDGMLILHLSNRFLDLKKVIQGFRIPEGYALYYASKSGVEKPADSAKLALGLFSHSQVALIAKESALPEEIIMVARWHKLEHDPDFNTWTDDFSNVLGVFKF